MMPTLAEFAPADWLVLGGYFVLLAASGVWLSRRKQESAEDYFLARHSIPAWAAAASLVATSLSAATFLAVPAFAYRRDLTYLSSHIGTIIAILIVAAVFIPAFYRHNVTTVYGLLEQRIGPGSKYAASAAFLVGRVFSEGARLYLAAIAGSLIMFGDLAAMHMLISIGVLVLIGIFYTFIGGIRSVIFSDVMQLGVFVGAAVVAIIVLLMRIPGDVGDVVSLLGEGGGGQSKLTIFTSGIAPDGVDLGNEFTLLAALTGLVLFNLAAYGTDHDMAQRMLTCRSAIVGARSAISAVIMIIPVAAIFLVVGLLLWVFYQQPQVMGDAAPTVQPDTPGNVFVTFILNELPIGLRGLLMAGLFAAAVSTVNSALNAMSAVFVTEFYRHFVPRRPEEHYVFMGRLGVIIAGVLVGGFAALSAFWLAQHAKGMLEFALGVMTFAYSGLLAVFLTAIFTRRGNDVSAIAALVVGFLVTLALYWQPWADEAIGGDPQSRLSLAYPYQMMIASAAAFAVCCLGTRSQPRESNAETVESAEAIH